MAPIREKWAMYKMRTSFPSIISFRRISLRQGHIYREANEAYASGPLPRPWEWS